MYHLLTQKPIKWFCMVMLILTLSSASVYLNWVTPVSAHPGSENSNCAASDYHIHGQTHGEWGPGGTPPNPNPPQNERTSLSWLTGPASGIGFGTERVAILIVDDFQNPNYVLSHGNFVFQLFVRLLPELIPAYGTHDLMLVPVDVGIYDPTNPGESHYSTDVLDDSIEANVTALQGLGVRRFVINMSFGVMPCHVAIDLETGQIVAGVTEESLGASMIWFDFFYFLEQHRILPSLSLAEYIEFLGANPGVINPVDGIAAYDEADTPFGDEGLIELFENPFDESEGSTGGFQPQPDQPVFAKSPPNVTHDPQTTLHQYLSSLVALNGEPLPSDPNGVVFFAVPVASAGNLSMSQPLAPGVWEEVLSISASVDDNDTPWAFSNAGEVITPGGWFDLGALLWNAGTSFSAPVASTLIGLHLTFNNVSCNFTPGDPLFSYHNDYTDHPIEEMATDTACVGIS